MAARPAPARVGRAQVAARMAARMAARVAALVTALACGPLAPTAHAGTPGATPPSVGLATWNLEWLITPEADRAMRPLCQAHQPRSDEHALPCGNGRQDTPQRTAADFTALSITAQRLLDEGVDAVALQEVDGASAARQVFRRGWVLACFTGRAHPQNVGFAIREGVAFRCNSPLQALDVDGSTRAGADLTLFPDTPHPVRLLAVHLKSGCFDGRLDRNFPPCERLRQQVPVLARWVQERHEAGPQRFAILGDFNRHLEKDARYGAGDDRQRPLNLVDALNQRLPAAAPLRIAAQGQPYLPCDRTDRHRAYIDHVLVSDALWASARESRFLRLGFTEAQEGRQLSDHCPVGVDLQGLRSTP